MHYEIYPKIEGEKREREREVLEMVKQKGMKGMKWVVPDDNERANFFHS